MKTFWEQQAMNIDAPFRQVGGSRENPHGQGAIWYNAHTDELVFWPGGVRGYLCDTMEKKTIFRVHIPSVAVEDFFGEALTAGDKPGDYVERMKQVLALARDYGIRLIGGRSAVVEEARIRDMIAQAAGATSRCLAA